MKNLKLWMVLGSVVVSPLVFADGVPVIPTGTVAQPGVSSPGVGQGKRSELKSDMKKDTVQIQQLNQKIKTDKEQLRSDRKQFGKGSSQVQADKAQLKTDREARKALKIDRKKDHEQLRAERHEHRHGKKSGS